jgi:predicted Zn-dependent protease
MKTIFSIFIFGFLVAACASSGKAPITENLLVSEDEKKLWSRAREEQLILNHSGLIYHDEELEAYLNQVAQSLRSPRMPDSLTFKIMVIKDPHLNAFAFPNGVIYIHTGILARMDNEAQLAALLGHEIIHCTQRHALRAMRGLKDPPALVSAVYETLSNITGLDHLAESIGLAGSMAAVTGYCHDFENEADQLGLELAMKAGYDPEAVLNLFNHLKEEIKLEGIDEPFFWGTHPRVQERIHNIELFLKGQNHNVSTGFKGDNRFLGKIQTLLLDNARLDIRLGRFQIARRGVEKYLQTTPDNARAFYLLGEICRQSGLKSETTIAMAHYQKAIALDPAFAAPHKAIGFIHFKEGKKMLARKFFESSLSLSPDSADRAYILGYLKQCPQQGGG